MDLVFLFEPFKKNPYCCRIKQWFKCRLLKCKQKLTEAGFLREKHLHKHSAEAVFHVGFQLGVNFLIQNL